MEALLHDSHFWVLLATIVFVIAAFKFGRAPILSLLDTRTEKIKNELDEAERLKEEAQELLADMHKQHRDALQTAQKIIDQAQETAKHLEAHAAQRMEETIKRRETQLLDRIARAEDTAVMELRNEAADIAAKAATVLLEEAAGKRGAKLVDDSIADIKNAA